MSHHFFLSLSHQPTVPPCSLPLLFLRSQLLTTNPSPLPSPPPRSRSLFLSQLPANTQPIIFVPAPRRPLPLRAQHQPNATTSTPSTTPPQHPAALTPPRPAHTSSTSAAPMPKPPAALSSSSPPQLIIPTRLHHPRRRPPHSHHEPQQHRRQPSHHQPQPLSSSPPSAPFFPAPPLLPQPSATADHNRHRPAPPSSSCLTKPLPHPAAPASLPPDHLHHDHSLTRLLNASHQRRQSRRWQPQPTPAPPRLPAATRAPLRLPVTTNNLIRHQPGPSSSFVSACS